MSVQSQENSPSFNLPRPGQNEKLPQQESEGYGSPSGEVQHAVALEKGVPTGNGPQPAKTTAPQNNVPSGPPPVVQAAPSQTTPQPASAGWMPQVADDTDLIEKEWVEKAKEIVAQTAHDPYLQNKEMNKVRADYMKKRYNKEIKLIED